MIERITGSGQVFIARQSAIRWVVFSDLDGTLLDHDTYDWQPAAAALAELERRRVPVVLVSSKTMAELFELRDDLGLAHPVVAENGASIDVPQGYFTTTGSLGLASVDRAQLQQSYRRLRAAGSFDCEAFYELGEAGIAGATGLTLAQARLANSRLASEPILWRDSEARLAAFAKAAANLGLRCIRGGRFVHLMGPNDKATAMARLLDAYRQQWPGVAVRSMALGDGPNDLDMLKAADIAVVIRGKHDQAMALDDHQRVIRPALAGPAGWAQAMQELLVDQFGEATNEITQGDSGSG